MGIWKTLLNRFSPAMKRNEHDVVLTGLPRSGTTLTCFLLNKLPDTLALHEPMAVDEFPGLESHGAICDAIRRFAREARRSIKTQRTVVTKHVNGHVPDNHFPSQYSESGLRRGVISRGEIYVEKELTRDFMLVIKHPAAFTAILESLTTQFPCYAVIRNPLSVLASWNSVAAPVENGHVPAAEQLDWDLAQTLRRTDDKIDRQLHILDYFFAKYRDCLPDASVLRYEDTVATGGKSLSVITPRAQALHEVLESKNKNPVYDRERMQLLGEKLLRSDGAYWHFYSRESVTRLLAA
jgi:hypothetical protein